MESVAERHLPTDVRELPEILADMTPEEKKQALAMMAGFKIGIDIKRETGKTG